MSENQYKIKDIERLTGIKAHTIRIWEKRYALLSPWRSDSNFRFYSDEDLKKILKISWLNRNGYKISLLSAMSEEELNELTDGLHKASIGSEHYQQMLLTSMTEFDETVFNNAYRLMHEQYGFEQLITSIIFPFLERIGTLWQTNTVNPAQEHFISALIRQKLILANESMRQDENNINPRKVLIMGYPNDPHELSLLFASYLFKAAGWRVIYLGIQVPLADIRSIADSMDLNSVYIHSVIKPAEDHFIESAKRFFKAFKDANIIFGGNYPSTVIDQISYPGLYFVNSTQQLLHRIV